MKLIRSWLGGLAGTIPFFATVKNWVEKFIQGKDSTKITPGDKGLKPQHFGKVEAVAFIV